MDDRFAPFVGFNLTEVALYMVPAGEDRRAKHLALKLPRDGMRGENDPNVRLLRAMERAAIDEMAQQSAGV